MNTYAITFREPSGIIQLRAEYYLFDSGFFRFYEINDGTGGFEEFASLSAVDIVSVVRQNEYTEAEVIAQIEGKG